MLQPKRHDIAIETGCCSPLRVPSLAWWPLKLPPLLPWSPTSLHRVYISLWVAYTIDFVYRIGPFDRPELPVGLLSRDHVSHTDWLSCLQSRTPRAYNHSGAHDRILLTEENILDNEDITEKKSWLGRALIKFLLEADPAWHIRSATSHEQSVWCARRYILCLISLRFSVLPTRHSQFSSLRANLFVF